MKRRYRLIPLILFLLAAVTLVWMSYPVVMFDRVENVMHDNRGDVRKITVDITGRRAKDCPVIVGSGRGYVELEPGGDWYRAQIDRSVSARDGTAEDARPEVGKFSGNPFARRFFGRWTFVLDDDKVTFDISELEIRRLIGVALYDCDDAHVVPMVFGPYDVGERL